MATSIVRSRSPPLPQPVNFKLQPSRRLGLGVVAAAAGGLCCVAAAGVPWWSTAAAAAAALSLVRHTWRAQVVRTSLDAVTALGVDGEGAWWLCTRTGGPRTAGVLAVSVQRWGIVATCRDAGGSRYPLFIAPDALPDDAFRRLSARLRTYPVGAAEERGSGTP